MRLPLMHQMRKKKILKIFSWVVTNIQPVPTGLHVIDDHLFNVIIRGYGASDQRTETFGLLASCMGFYASSLKLTPPGNQKGIFVSLIKSKHDIWIFDIVNQIAFRDADGHLVDLHNLIANPSLIERAAGDLIIEGIPYPKYILYISALQPDFSRLEAQKPFPRIRQVFGRLLRCFQN